MGVSTYHLRQRMEQDFNARMLAGGFPRSRGVWSADLRPRRRPA